MASDSEKPSVLRPEGAKSPQVLDYRAVPPTTPRRRWWAPTYDKPLALCVVSVIGVQTTLALSLSFALRAKTFEVVMRDYTILIVTYLLSVLCLLVRYRRNPSAIVVRYTGFGSMLIVLPAVLIDLLLRNLAFGQR